MLCDGHFEALWAVAAKGEKDAMLRKIAAARLAFEQPNIHFKKVMA